MDPLYQEHILDHYKHPHNKGRMEDFEVSKKGVNASCGDDLILYLRWRDNHLVDITFEGFGCAISQSGASMLTDKVKGMSREDIGKMEKKDMDELYGIEISPQREKCAMLAMETLHDALSAD